MRVVVILSMLLSVWCWPTNTQAASLVVNSEFTPDAFPLVLRQAAPLWIDANDFEVVHIAAEAFCRDINDITGIKPNIHSDNQPPGDKIVMIGTLGHSSWVDQLAQQGQLPVERLRNQWETFVITTIDQPLTGVDQALVIIGSDRRGTAFGVFEVSMSLGVSPWVWWADVRPKQRSALYVTAKNSVQGPPSVKYRGIFLNDEDWGLQPWAAQHLDTDIQDIGPKTYARIFELLLRLKANFIWPAMHPSTRAFNYYPDNKLVADRYAIVMGSSHAEPMLRNNVDEWERDGSGPWNYVSNRDAVLQYWDRRIAENGRFENVYTIGMRGIHDSGMTGGGTAQDKVRRLEQIFADQRSMLERHIGKPADRIPQVFVPYKEVLGIYRSGLDVPPDVILGWIDDNHGYIRQLSDADERRRPGGSGVYYHLSYWGRPHDFLWLSSVPPGLVWEEMTKALAYGADRLWVANVGDIKPAELGMDWFLRLAWNTDRYGPGDARRGLVDFFRENFGDAQADAMADVMSEYYRLNHARKPEHMGWSRVYPNTRVRDGELSHWAHGDEAQRRLDAFDALQSRAEAIGESLPVSYRDAYFELVLYPVRGAADMNRKLIHAEKSRRLAQHGWPAANEHARLARAAYDRIQQNTRRYNDEIANGKWRGMMSAAPRGLPVYGMPPVGTVTAAGTAGLDVRVEGKRIAALPVDAPPRTVESAPDQPSSAAPLTEQPNRMPVLNRYTRRNAFIDLYNTGAGSIRWQAEANEPWVQLSRNNGQFETHQRIQVAVDFSQPPRIDLITTTIEISTAGASYRLVLPVRNPAGELPTGTFIQENDAIAIDAEHFNTHAPGAEGCTWRVIEGVGYTGACVGLFPRLLPEGVTLIAGQSAPTLAYPLHVFEDGAATLSLQALPTHEINAEHALVCAIAIDEGPPQTIRFAQGNDEHNGVWQRNVLRGAMTGSAPIDLTAGAHTLSIFGIDPSVVLDRVTITFDPIAPAYLGPRETRVLPPASPFLSTRPGPLVVTQ